MALDNTDPLLPAPSHRDGRGPRGRFASFLSVFVVLNAVLPSLLVVLCLWPVAQRTGWRNYWFDDRYLYDQAATMQERLGLCGDDPHELDAVRDRMPLYPLVLRTMRALEALTSVPVPAWSILVNVLAHAVGCVLLFFLVAGVARDRRLALGAALLWPWLPGVVPYTLAQLPEAVSTTLCLASGYLVVSASMTDGMSLRRSGASGLLLGLATLFKPVFCYFSLPVLWLLWKANRAGGAKRYSVCVAFLLSFLVPVSGWLARNYAVWGVVTLTPNGASHIANARDALASEIGLPAVNSHLPHSDADWWNVGIDPSNLPARSAYRSQQAGKELREWMPEVAWGSVKSLIKLHASTGFGALVTMSRGELAVAAEDHQANPYQHGLPVGWQILQIFLYFVLAVAYALAAVGLYALRRNPDRRILFWWAVLTLAYFVLLSVPFGNTRYRYPAMPAYAALAAAGLIHCLQRWSRRNI